MPRMENWSFGSDGDAFTAPECRRPVLQGNVFGHPNFPDNSTITTSTVQGWSKGTVKCKNRDYQLGQVDPKFAEYLEGIGSSPEKYLQ